MSLKVGQKVVAIRNHSRGIFKKGDVFTVLQTSYTSCCQEQNVDIGITAVAGRGYCRACNVFASIHTKEWWIASKLFVPITEEFQSISLTKVLEKETPLIGVN